MRDYYTNYSRYKSSKDAKKSYNYQPRRGESNNANDDEGEVWDSGLEVLKDGGTVHVPDKVRKLCTAIQREIPGTEFGMLFKGEWRDGAFKVDAEDYVIPEQDVSAAHITFTEDLKKYRDRGFTVHIHSHPNSGRSSGFSGTDDKHVNSQFECALLYGGGAEEVVDGIVNVEVCDGTYVQLDPDVVTQKDEDLPDVDMDNIEKKKRKTKKKKTGNITTYKEGKQSTFGEEDSYSIIQEEEPEGRPFLYNSTETDEEDIEWDKDAGHYIVDSGGEDDPEALFVQSGYIFNPEGNVVGRIKDE